MLRTKYTTIFQREIPSSSGGGGADDRHRSPSRTRMKKQLFFGVFHKEQDRDALNTREAKALCNLMNISAVVTDPKKPDYVCLRYVEEKHGPATDLYFQIVEQPLFIESMHLLIELLRAMRKRRKKGGKLAHSP
ncbi:unnamed protein product [Amoebophrya sp. A25]|nr:unnamed protein product [Amoebophrya sp. A25]|eukprot:GSA25T00000259001.1